MSKALVVGLFCGLVALAACGGSPPLPIMVTAEQNNSTQTIAVGQELQVALTSNATTGYSWNLTTTPDPQILMSIGSQYAAPESQVPGAGGTQTWSFKGVKAGSTSLILKYYKPSAPADNPGPSYSLNVTVK